MWRLSPESMMDDLENIGLSQRKLAPSVHGVCGEKVKMIQEALSHAPSPVHRQGAFGDEA